MKILIVNDDFAPESVGGAGKVALDLSLGFKKFGHEVVVLTTTQNRNNDGRSVYMGVPVIRLYFSYKSKFWRSYLVVCNPFLVRRLKRVIREEKPDVIHFHNVHSFISFAAVKAAKKSGIKKVFLTAHDVISFSYTRLYHFINLADKSCKKDYDYRVPLSRLLSDAGKSYNPFRNIIIRHYLKYCDKIFAVSGALKKALNQNGIGNVEVLYNGIDMEEFSTGQADIDKIREKLNLKKNKVVFFGGRGMSGKGADVLIKAFGEVVSLVPEVVLVIASDHNKYEEYLKKIVSELGLEKNVIFAGLFSGKELSALFGLADVVVVPSTYFDPAPLMTMQAMAVGRPVVGTCFGGTPEIVEDGVTGFILNPYNAELMSKRLVEILKEDDLRNKMGVAGKERVDNRFSLDKQVEETLSHYLK